MRNDHGLISHDSLVTVSPGNKIFVPLHNKEAFSRSVKKDVKVGTAVTLNEKQIGEVKANHCNRVQSETDNGSGKGKPRIEQLLAILNLSKDQLSLIKYEKLKDFLYSKAITCNIIVSCPPPACYFGTRIQTYY